MYRANFPLPEKPIKTSAVSPVAVKSKKADEEKNQDDEDCNGNPTLSVSSKSKI